MPIKNDKSI